ncbi:MAG TPA: hypothetical protein VKA43_18155 [Gammaproteobacteria bacterium]|nr:hypothetical protein [Gammaproteobacteria bacterium]
MQGTNWKRELTIFSALFAGGLFLIPIAVYVVGQRLFGEYMGGDVLALAESIWGDFLTLRPAAWVLVLGPYLTVLLLRALRRLWWPKKV